MKVIPTFGPERSKKTMAVAIMATLMLLIMLVAQLYGYEEFCSVVSSVTGMHLSAASIVASIIVVSELLALPYLLGMYLSALMRVVSAMVGFCIAGFWVLASFTNAHAANSGLFSDSYVLPGGLFAAVWAVVLFVLICKTIASDSKFRHATS